MEHHESDFFGPYKFELKAPEPPVLACPDCTRTFTSAEDLEVHRFDGHPFSRPVLLLKGREYGRSRLSVTQRTTDRDWELLDCRSMSVNGRAFDPKTAGATLSAFTEGVVSVALKGVDAEQIFELKFSVADPVHLQGVDDRLYDMARGHQLTIEAIENFLEAAKEFPTARDYTDAIANYLYGVLARERSPESGLPHDEYRERFDQAVAMLGGFDRPVADAICGLVAFHYNQFDNAVVRTRSPRVSWISHRLLRLLHGETLGADASAAPERSSLDYVLSDALTEQVLSWCSLPLDGSASPAEVRAMESSLPDQEPFDRLKLRMVAAEHYLGAGAPDLGVPHANELRHNPVAEEWARTYLAKSEGE